MNIAYVTTVRMPTEKAHGLQIMQMCRAFAQAGHKVTLLVPKRQNTIAQDAFSYYGLPQDFTIEYLPCVDALRFANALGNPALWITSFTFGLAAARRLAALAPDVAYTRDPLLAPRLPASAFRVFEAHDFPKSIPSMYGWLWKRFDRIVTVTEGLRATFIGRGVPAAKLLVAPDAVEIEKFNVKETKEDARRALGLPMDVFLAVYVGHLYPQKGADDVLSAAAKLDGGIRVAIVGATEGYLEKFRARVSADGMKNVILPGRVPHADVPRWLRAADVTLLPNRGGSAYDERYVSPMKLFEYAAAGRAIVATELPSIREVLKDGDAIFVPPECPDAIASALNRLAKSPSEVARLEASSRALAARYTWSARVKTVLAGIPRK